LSNIASSSLKDLFLRNTPLIDVRAPVEFLQGSLPGAVNLPIMNNEERALVGTTYKQAGREKAMALGHELVSGEVRDHRMQLWIAQIRNCPESVIYCFRGGLRSQITQRWLSELAIKRPLIQGGYKKARQFLREGIDHFSSEKSLLMISGPTGSAKTDLLKRVQSVRPTVDLEALAFHRGSAFGALGSSQPSQIDFENTLSVQLLKLSDSMTGQKVLVEDESRLIGRCAIPESFFIRMRDSEVVYVEESFEQRVENIFQDYILKTGIGRQDLDAGFAQFIFYKNAVMMISRKLGGARAQEILQDLEVSQSQFLANHQDIDSNRVWIAKLLNYYYDPLYAGNLAKRSPKIVMRGNSSAVFEYLSR
jgi:tRNA 2-selenouridine synthase